MDYLLKYSPLSPDVIKIIDKYWQYNYDNLYKLFETKYPEYVERKYKCNLANYILFDPKYKSELIEIDKLKEELKLLYNRLSNFIFDEYAKWDTYMKFRYRNLNQYDLIEICNM